VLYALLCDLEDPSKVIARPSGFFLAPEGDERVGDVSNVAFCNGAVMKATGEVFVYYASSDTRRTWPPRPWTGSSTMCSAPPRTRCGRPPA